LFVALTGSGTPERLAPAAAGLFARLRAWLADGNDRSLAQRMAGTAFVIRIAAAALTYLSQILLARWMGASEFGIYVYVWTWVMLIGALVDLGLASSAQRFIPEYAGRGELARLRGFLAGSRWIAFFIAAVIAVVAALGISLLRPWLDDATIVPLYLACTCLPAYGVLHVQDGIARSYNWANLALLPPYIVRQLFVVAAMGAAWLAGAPTDAVSAVIIAATSLWLTALGQLILLNRALTDKAGSGERKYDIPHWLSVSMPIFAVELFASLLLYVDVLILKQYRPAEEIGIYYAALKTLSLVSFVHFAVAAAAAHRFAAYQAAGDRTALRAFAADAVRWTFWPSLAMTLLLLAAGWPLLWLFGRDFTGGYHLMFIFTLGVLARASVGPAERFLVMLGQQRACALVSAAAFAVNLVLCLLLIPPYGATGAAISISTAFLAETLLLFLVARSKLGAHLFVFGGPAAR
jgi:O-antigen/teichoic acid export membrane protein